MRVLMLTWEFPPYIAGGLGMACYGLVKSLLSSGVEVDLILPTVEEVYFPMRSPEDVDVMPAAFLEPEKRSRFLVQTTENLIERLRIIGVFTHPETYLAPGASFDNLVEVFFDAQTVVSGQNVVETIRNYLHGDEPIFKKVREIALRAVKFSKLLNFDLIHAHDWLTYPAGLALKAISGKKLVSHIHATEFDRAGGQGDERIHKIEYAGLAHSDAVVAVSRYTAKMVIDRYRIEPQKIHVIHNAYSVSHNTGAAKDRIFKEPLVLFLGRITLQKGPDYFVKIAEKVLKKFPGVRFVMAGSGDMFSRMIHVSASKRLKQRFLFTGFLNRRQVEGILSATDIFVLPSVSEPFGIVPLEAMAFGAAAIVSKQSGVSEVVKNVFKVDFWDIDKTVDIIVDLLENPEKRRKIAEAGRKEVLEIGWHEAVLKLKKIYEEIR